MLRQDITFFDQEHNTASALTSFLSTETTHLAVLACGFFRFWMLVQFQARSKKAYEKSASYACEATSAIRTVASLTREDDVWQNYNSQLVDQQAASLKSILQSSGLYATSQSITFLAIALGRSSE
ncbi:hypothetical protein K4K49_004227 [Colletotrichum sp. SAR 10_70]|nr:hypothetical protein K4K50_011439 [Colletotrichum sp. SAR 10_71]KAI8171451.1 hypothetical protein K4K49_004227 [Colletotrichum sp. SAR 10_70]KAJ4994881.1 hypothetical protein K4K48_011632 [Colletotrichum sp. SAR 10_66]